MLTPLFVLLLAAAGLVAGLVPGIHMNTFSLLASKLPVPAEALALGLGAAFVAHSASSLLPSIFLGAPSESTALAVLPGHRMLFKGEGKKALHLSMYGLVLGSLFFLILAVPLYGLLPVVTPFLRGNMGIILAVASGYMIIGEKEPAKALFVFAISGALGIIVLGMPLKEETKLFTLLTGAFGLSGLLMGSLSGKSGLPPQKAHMDEPSLKTLARPAAVGTLAGALVGTLPAMSSSVSLSLLGAFFEKRFWESTDMLVSIGAANITGFLFSLVTLAAVGKARNGTAHIISGLVDGKSALLPAGVALAAVFVSVAAVVFLSGKFVSAIRKVDYADLNRFSLLFLLLLVFVGGGGQVGLLIAAPGASISILTVRLGTGRANAMGMLLVPTILFYIGL